MSDRRHSLETPPADRQKSLGDLETGVDAGRTSADLEAAAASFEDLDVEVVDLGSRYEIVGALGRGGMGEVLKAIDRRLRRPVAIKRVRGDLAHHPQALARFLTEARAVAALNHFNIVQVHDYGRSTDGPFLVMEFVDGQSLADRLEQGPLPLPEAIDLACQICDALSRAHSQGIIHRDIKPANILLTSGGSAKLSDFGLARQEGGDRGQTQTGAVLGTLDFMPPEQRVDASRADARSDLWSLAATLYQAVTGKPPKVIRLTQVPVELQPVLERALDDDPAGRFQTAAEFRHSLREVAGQLQKPSGAPIKIGQCPRCATVNDSLRKFCLQCGCSLRQPCPACGVPAGAWEPFCGECGANIPQAIERLLSDAATQKENAEQLRGEFRHAEALPILELLAAHKHPALAPVRDWAAALRPRVQEELQQLETSLSSSLNEARQRYEAHDDAQVLKLLEGIPQPLRTAAVLELSQAASVRRTEVHRLLREIRTAMTLKQYEGLLTKVQRLLELRPADRSGIKLREQLQQRESRSSQKRDSRAGPADTRSSTGQESPTVLKSLVAGPRGWSPGIVAMAGGGGLVLVVILWNAFRGGEPQPRESAAASAATTSATTTTAATTSVATPRVATDTSATTTTTTKPPPGENQAAVEDKEIVLFNGHDLTGWRGDTRHWSVENGAIAGRVWKGETLDRNICLIWMGEPVADFELRGEFRLERGNSGVHYRSRVQPTSMVGPQFDIDAVVQSYTGAVYEERARGTLARLGQSVRVEPDGTITELRSLGPRESLQASIRKDDWNEFAILASGNRIVHEINGLTVAAVTDNDERRRFQSGDLGLQLHAGGEMAVFFRNLRLKRRGSGPSLQESAAAAPTTGFMDLFDGKTLIGWSGSGHIVRNGTIVCTSAGILETARSYRNFIFRCEVQVPRGANHGIGLRAPAGATATETMEIQIFDDHNIAGKDWSIDPSHRFGSLYGVIPAKTGHLKPTGDWNDLEIACRGSSIAVTLNGVEILNTTVELASSAVTRAGLSNPKKFLSSTGRITLKGNVGQVAFRNLRILELPE